MCNPQLVLSAVPPGTDVFISPYFVHRHPDYWSDAEKFIPDRFERLDEDGLSVDSLASPDHEAEARELAAGLDALVLDVKVGSGAFMGSLAEARALASALVEVANGAGCPTRALITDMNEPLASAAGNALEMVNAARFLTGEAIDGRLWDVTVALGAESLARAGIAAGVEDGADRMRMVFESGAAAERFEAMVRALGGPADFLDDYERHLVRAPVVAEVTAREPGFIRAIDTKRLGFAVVELGGGRRRASDRIDHSVGLDDLLGLGAAVEVGSPLARVHAANPEALAAAEARVRASYHIGDAPLAEAPLILDRIG